MRPRLRITVSILTTMLLLLTFVGQTQARSLVQKHMQTPLSLPSPLYNNVTLGKPKWWTGINGAACDDTNYYANSLPQTHSAKLGATYRGVKACGPMPINGAPEVGVQFYTTPTIAPTENEWDCTELVKRYLYQAFGAPDLSANGKDVVSAYTNPLNNDLFKSYSNNGTVNQMPVAGDVLSFAATSNNSAGHTAIVKAVKVDAFGNGTITIMDENNGNDPNGTGTLSVRTWVIGTQSEVGAVTGWLDTKTTVPSYNASSNDLLRAVSVYDASNVWAVGFSYGSSLIEHWDGAHWTQQTSANPGNYQNILYGVKALSATNIWAVGSYLNTDNSGGVLIEHTTNGGTTWTQDTSSYIGAGGATLAGIDGVSTSNAWAVGNDTNGNALTLKLVSGHFASQTNVTPNTSITLSSVAERTSTDIWAVGTHGSNTFSMHYNGTAWSIPTNTTPNPGTSNNLYGVTAIGASDVWAVGRSTTSGSVGFLTHWNGTAWSSATSLSLGTYSALYAVAALNTNNIWAVGIYSGGTLVYHSGNGGSTWQQVTSDSPGSSNPPPQLNGIAINKVNGNTWTVGYYNQSSLAQTLTEFFN